MKIATTNWEMFERLGSKEASLRALAEAGFDACDFSMWDDLWHEGHWDASDAEFDAHYIQLKKVADACGLIIDQTHAPFPTTCGDEHEDAYRLGIIRRAIRATALLGCKYTVVHPAKHMDKNPDPGFALAARYNLDMYASLIPDLEQAGVSIAIENMFHRNRATGLVVQSYCSLTPDLLTAVNTLGRKHFCVCLDVGHAVLVGKSPADMVRELGDALGVLHVHDNNGLNDQHLLPGLGIVDWDAFCLALRECHFSGTFSLEATGFLRQFPEGTEPASLRLMASIARAMAAKVDAP